MTSNVQPHLLAAKNLNLSAAQKELVRRHQRLSHAGLSTIHNLCRQKRQARADSVEDLNLIRSGQFLPCKYNVPSCSREGLLCAACETSKATRRSPDSRPTCSHANSEMKLKVEDLQPGDRVSCDHFISPVEGRAVAPSGYSSSRHGYTCGTIYVDHTTGYVFVRCQQTVSATDTIRGKLLFEREAADVNVKIKAYHSDNGVFNSAEFTNHCKEMNQKL